ncbi:MAG: hypothetical protein WA138_05030 [Parvibaculum sp.]
MAERNSETGKKSLPRLDIKTKINHSPHVVILGAGASRACCPAGDKNGRPLPLMADFVEKVEIVEIIKEAGYDPSGNFEQIYSRMHAAGKQDVIEKIDVAVRDYFGGLELPDAPTFYDYLVLSLRPKDSIVTFNWDPLVVQAYKRWRHLGKVLPNLIFLHGNVDLGVDQEQKTFTFLSDKPSQMPTKLLYPVEKKDYQSDEFVADQWTRATDALSKAYYVTIVGYSAPQTDVEAKSLLLNAWRDNTTKTLAQFSIIDLRPVEEVEVSWSDFLDGVHGGARSDVWQEYLMIHPRRTCEAFAFATLQLDPWEDDHFPAAKSLKDLEVWIKPLIDEEATGQISGGPYH